MFKYILGLLLLSTTNQALSQELKIGQYLPPLTLPNVLNYSSSSINLDTFKGKLVILDFWSTHCLACLQAFPLIDSLQKKFEDKVQFILVNSETPNYTKDFFARHLNIHLPSSVPLITGDSTLIKYFPHIFKPYHIWINPNGTVQYKFSANNTAEWRIKDYLDGNHEFVRPDLTQIQYISSFINPEFNHQLRYFSYLINNPNKYHLPPNDYIPGFVQFSYNCGSAVELYKWAYYEDYIKMDFDRPGRLVVKLKNPYPYVRPQNTARDYSVWLEKYSYNYHLLWPEERKQEIYEEMKLDLNRYFRLDTHLGINYDTGWVLIRLGHKDKLKSKGGETISNFYISDITTTEFDSVRQFRNAPFSKLSSALQTIIEYNFKQPFLDSTAYSGNVDFEMSAYDLDHLSIELLRRALNKYGVDLERRLCAIPALIITDEKEDGVSGKVSHLP